MQSNNLIEKKLLGYEDFLKYCEESGKKFIDELDKEDFIAYRAEYSVSREQVEKIKNLLDFQEHKPAEEISQPQNISNELDVIDESLKNYFNIDDLSPYEKVLISDLDFNDRVQNCLRLNGYRTLAELLKASQQKILCLRNFGQGSFKNLISTLKKFFYEHKKELPRKMFGLPTKSLTNFCTTRF